MKTSSILAIAAAACMGGNQAEAKLSAGGNTIFDVLVELGGGLLDLIINTTSRRETIHVGGPASDLRTRQAAPPGVPQFEFDRCYENLGGASITLTAPGPGSLAISGVPATCMNLANVLISGPGEGAIALPCGSDCLQYDGLSDAEYNTLLDIANNVAG